jgi:hypothetical protein
MNNIGQEPDETAVEDWLQERHSALIIDLTDALDLNIGLCEATIPGQHHKLVTDLAGVLNLEAGLAAIMPCARVATTGGVQPPLAAQQRSKAFRIAATVAGIAFAFVFFPLALSYNGGTDGPDAASVDTPLLPSVAAPPHTGSPVAIPNPAAPLAPAPKALFPIGINATALDYTSIVISDVGWKDAHQMQVVRLRPGAYHVESPVGYRARFRVDDTGQVDYDSSLDGILSGRASSLLTLNGLVVSIDSSDLDYADIMVSGTEWRTPEAAQTFRLLPGKHHVASPVGNLVDFTISDTGRIDYEASQDNLLSGRGSSELTIHGLAITIDATATNHSRFLIFGVGWRDARQAQIIRLLPGRSHVQIDDRGGLDFTLTNLGLIDYSPWLNGILSGQDTSRLTITEL